MSLKSVAVLFVVLVILCLGYWLMVSTEEKARREVIEAKKLYTFKPEDLHTVRVKRIGEPATVGTQSEAGAWKIIEPHAIEARGIVWDRVAKAVAGLSNERTIEAAPQDPAKYGLLDEPQLTVTASSRTGEEIHLAFGDAEPTQTYRYAQAGEGAIFLVSNNAFLELNRSLLDLRYRYLFHTGETGFTWIEYTRIFEDQVEDTQIVETVPSEPTDTGTESRTIVLERGDDGLWYMRRPVRALADQAQVAALVREIRYAVGRDYVDEPESLTLYGLSPPSARLTVKAGPGRPGETVYLGDSSQEDETGGIFVKRASSPAVFVIDARVINAFPEEPFAFREKRLLTHSAINLRAIDYRAGDTDVLLEKHAEKGWQLARPAAGDTDQVAVSDFIALLKQLEGGKYFPGATRPEFGLDEPAVTITLTFEGEEEPVTIRVGAALPDDSGDFYATQDTGAVTTLSGSALERLTVDAFHFRSKDLLRFDKDRALTVAMVFEGTAYLFEKAGGKWAVKEPAGMSWETQSDMEALLEAVARVRAVALEAETMPEDLGRYGLDAPILALRVTVASDDTPAMPGPLTIGKTAPDDWHQRFALYDDGPEIFRVKQAVIDDVREALRGLREESAP